MMPPPVVILATGGASASRKGMRIVQTRAHVEIVPVPRLPVRAEDEGASVRRHRGVLLLELRVDLRTQVSRSGPGGKDVFPSRDPQVVRVRQRAVGNRAIPVRVEEQL